MRRRSCDRRAGRGLALREVADPVEDLEAAPRDRIVRPMRMVDRDDRVAGAPDDERGKLGGELQPVVGADALAADADHGTERPKKSRPAVRIGQRVVAAADLLGGGSRAEADTPSPLDDGAARLGHRRATEEPEHVLRAGKGEGPQQQVHLPPETAAPNQHEALAELRELVGELHGHAAAERVSDDRGALVPEDDEHIPEERRVRAQRIVTRRLRRLPVAEEVRRDDREPAGEQRADPRPCLRVARHPVNEQQDGPVTGETEPHPMAVQGHGVELRRRSEVAASEHRATSRMRRTLRRPPSRRLR